MNQSTWSINVFMDAAVGHMDQVDFNHLTWFRIVAEERSFTKAAARIGVAQSTLSHTIKQLEARMGIRLLTRTTRNVATTVAGERLLRTITPRMAEIEEEIGALMEFRDKPSGSIKLTLSDHALESVVWPKLKSILKDYPDISVELLLDSTFRNIVEEGFDAGVRLGESIEKDMIAVRIGPDWRWLRWHRQIISTRMACQSTRRISSGTSASTCATRPQAVSMRGSLQKTVRSCGFGSMASLPSITPTP